MTPPVLPEEGRSMDDTAPQQQSECAHDTPPDHLRDSSTGEGGSAGPVVRAAIESRPQQKRLRHLEDRQASLTSTLSDLQIQHAELMAHLLPYVDAVVQPTTSTARGPASRYLPSTYAHTTSVPGSQSFYCSGARISPDEPVRLEARSAIMNASQTKIKEHIKLLHKYNEVKDIAQGLIGMIAEQRGVRIVDIMPEFDVGVND